MVLSDFTILANPLVIGPKASKTCTTSVARFTSSLMLNSDLVSQKAKEVVDDSDIENSFQLPFWEFERSTVHDLFKVAFHRLSHSSLCNLFIKLLDLVLLSIGLG